MGAPCSLGAGLDRSLTREPPRWSLQGEPEPGSAFRVGVVDGARGRSRRRPADHPHEALGVGGRGRLRGSLGARVGSPSLTTPSHPVHRALQGTMLPRFHRSEGACSSSGCFYSLALAQTSVPLIRGPETREMRFSTPAEGGIWWGPKTPWSRQASAVKRACLHRHLLPTGVRPPRGSPAPVRSTPGAEPGWPGMGALPSPGLASAHGKRRPRQPLAHLPRTQPSPGSSLRLGSKVVRGQEASQTQAGGGTHALRAAMMVFPDAPALEPASSMAGGENGFPEAFRAMFTDLSCNMLKKPPLQPVPEPSRHFSHCLKGVARPKRRQ